MGPASANGGCGQGQALWTPDRRTLSEQNLEKFRILVNEKYGLDLGTYHELHKWSVTHRADFWAEVWRFTDVIHSAPWRQVVDESQSIDAIPKWFQGSKLNYAENLLEKFKNENDIAVYYKGEGHPTVEKITYKELRQWVSAWAAALRSVGVKSGDVVAGVLPNCPQTLMAVLATASLGATWTCTSPEYGVTGIVERFQQTEPKVVISVNAVFYNGKFHPMLPKIYQVVENLPSVSKTVIIPFVDIPSDLAEDNRMCDNWVLSTEFTRPFSQAKLDYEQVPFDHPLFIMYSSGTTGKPKCMVHSVGGTLIKHLEEHVLQSSLTFKDIIFYYTTTGWMMYNWLISSLATGCSIVLYDGSPSPALWDMIDEIGITIFGTSAKWLAVQEDIFLKADSNPSKLAKLNKNHTNLRMVLSTGSPLKPESFDFVYNYVKKDVVLGSVAGGTDIIGCFMGQNTVLPVYRGEIQSFHLGCDLDCADETGQSVVNAPGELVVRSAFPSMPTNFYNDHDGLLYKKAYFAKFKGLWAHGDFMLIEPSTKGIVMLGRSDATLNPNGVRFGSAEIYQIVEKFPEVVDSVCVGQKNRTGSDERVVLFLKLAPGATFDNRLVTQLKKTVREHLSPRHVPAIILPIEDIPYTISGKKVEIAVRNVIENIPVKNLSALSNPKSLDLYKDLSQLLPWE